jgi:hypothetical protein
MMDDWNYKDHVKTNSVDVFQQVTGDILSQMAWQRIDGTVHNVTEEMEIPEISWNDIHPFMKPSKITEFQHRPAMITQSQYAPVCPLPVSEHAPSQSTKRQSKRKSAEYESESESEFESESESESESDSDSDSESDESDDDNFKKKKKKKSKKKKPKKKSKKNKKSKKKNSKKKKSRTSAEPSSPADTTPNKPAIIEKIACLIDYLPNELADAYDTWLEYSLAIYNYGTLQELDEDDIYDLIDKFSQKSLMYVSKFANESALRSYIRPDFDPRKVKTIGKLKEAVKKASSNLYMKYVIKHDNHYVIDSVNNDNAVAEIMLDTFGHLFKYVKGSFYHKKHRVWLKEDESRFWGACLLKLNIRVKTVTMVKGERTEKFHPYSASTTCSNRCQANFFMRTELVHVFKTKQFIDYDTLPEHVVLVNQIKRPYPRRVIEEDRQWLMDRVLVPIFMNEDQCKYFLHVIARLMAGHATDDKRWYILRGERNSGKGVLTYLMKEAFNGGHVEEFDADNFHEKPGGDKAYAFKWVMGINHARLMLSNEFNTSLTVSTNNLKSLTGGDTIKCRIARGHVTSIFMHGSFMCNVNDFPKVDNSDVFQNMEYFHLVNKFKPAEELKSHIKTEKLADASIKVKVVEPEIADAFLQLVLEEYAVERRVMPAGMKEVQDSYLEGFPKVIDLARIIDAAVLFTEDPNHRITASDMACRLEEGALTDEEKRAKEFEMYAAAAQKDSKFAKPYKPPPPKLKACDIRQKLVAMGATYSPSHWFGRVKTSGYIGVAWRDDMNSYVTRNTCEDMEEEQEEEQEEEEY